jgi:hypothetical protein
MIMSFIVYNNNREKNSICNNVLTADAMWW